jgi:hypothetical protein
MLGEGAPDRRSTSTVPAQATAPAAPQRAAWRASSGFCAREARERASESRTNTDHAPGRYRFRRSASSASAVHCSPSVRGRGL